MPVNIARCLINKRGSKRFTSVISMKPFWQSFFSFRSV